MFILITIIHIIVSLFLIGVVLLQSGQSGDIAAAFGGMGSQTAFGPRSAANTLTRATTVAAVIFMLTSFTLAIMSTREGSTVGGSSVLGNTPTQQQQAPAPKK
ncbi:MAG: preprotein translocase subunit SecG [Terriglobia bacterium]|jgi:preprotein translocase subunit SecG|nr:preprotein translocase subunit SecG [Terriglobia bacterium]